MGLKKIKRKVVTVQPKKQIEKDTKLSGGIKCPVCGGKLGDDTVSLHGMMNPWYPYNYTLTLFGRCCATCWESGKRRYEKLREKIKDMVDKDVDSWIKEKGK